MMKSNAENSIIIVKPNNVSPSNKFLQGKSKSNVENNKEAESKFYESISFVIFLGQCFGLMPVNGIRSNDASKINFKWISPKMFYTLFSLFGTLLTTSLYLLQFINNGNHLTDIVNIVFYSSSCIAIIIFIRLSYVWLDLNKKWIRMETFMEKYPYQPNIRKRFHIITGILMFLAFGEHIMAEISTIHKSQECPISKINSVKAYFVYNFSQTFSRIPYHIILAIFMEVFTLLATFVWNYSDLFIILLCSAIAERFRQLNKVVQNAEVINEAFWKQVREDYTGLSILCKSTDDAICNLISLSFGNNLFFICIQLFHTLEKLDGFISTAYFVCSFGILLTRTLTLCMYCCWINDESKVILNKLFEIPSEEFRTEANRFVQQIAYSPIAVSGSKYFYVTRGLCLQVAGAIITFELILVQLSPAFSKYGNDETHISCSL